MLYASGQLPQYPQFSKILITDKIGENILEASVQTISEFPNSQSNTITLYHFLSTGQRPFAH